VGLKNTAENLVLKPLGELTRAQQSSILSIRNQDPVRMNMYNTHVIGEEEHMAWVERTLADPSTVFYAVMLEGQIVGAVSLSGWSKVNRRADWAFYLDTTIQGKGIGAALEYRFLTHVFHDLNLAKLNCEVLDFNDKVVALHKKFGFHEEGIRRAHIRRGEESLDVVLLGITRGEWAARKRDLDKSLFK
jgi:UDP-4-amino-4,6-dideoxy-N-acetyl-beta-L-altrosamine N-acetyltransferase